MEVTKQHKLIFFLSHVLGQLPYNLRVVNGNYELFESRIRLAHTKLLAVIMVSLQIYGLWCAVGSQYAFVPDLLSKTIFFFAYLNLLECLIFTFWKTITKRDIFRFWFRYVNGLQFDDSVQTTTKKSLDTEMILLVVDLLWFLVLSIYDIFFFRKKERITELHPACQVFYFLDFTSVIHFTSLWEIKICCRFFMLFGNVLQKFYKNTNEILQEGRKRSSKRFWLNQLKNLRVKDLQAKDLIDFLHSYYIPVVLGEIIWAFSSVLITLSARVGIDGTIQCVWTIYIFWDIIFILKYCQSLEKEAEKTTLNLHQLFVNCDDDQIKEEIELFSLQVLHKKIEFNALGFFKLNFTLLYSIIGSLTSYVVILSQFQDESRSLKSSCQKMD